MNTHELLSFVKKLLTNLHISSYIIDYCKKHISSDVDLGLRKLLYNVESYENLLFNSLNKANDNTVYRFIDEYGCNYIFLKLPKTKKYFFCGPYLLKPITEKKIFNTFKKRYIPQEIIQQIIIYYNKLPVVSDENILFSIINSLGQELWGGIENFKAEYIEYPIPDTSAPLSVWKNISTEKQEEFSLSTIEENYRNEKILMKAVAKGELHKVTAISSAVFNNGTEERLLDSLRNRKNYLIILNTLLRKAVENGGVHPFHIHTFSSKYAQKIENILSIEDSFKLQSEMIREYCILVRQKSIKKYSFYVGKAITLISYDLTADLSLKCIAATLQVNPSYLSTLFTKECGCTLTDYVHDQRIEEAMRMLLQTNKSILQISIDCGFNDVRYFNRCFKKKNGITPTEYRITSTN